MIRPRSFVTMVAVAAALLVAATGAFTPMPIASCRQQSLLHVGAALPSPQGSFGGGVEVEDVRDMHVAMPRGVHAPIAVINSPRELAEFLYQDDRICVIKFHAAWCKSCQRFGRKFQGLASFKTDWTDRSGKNVVREGPMRFGSIEFGTNLGMCRTLGIKRLPTIHFYQRGQKLDGFPCGPAKFPILLDKVDLFLQADNDASLEEMTRQGGEWMSREQVAGVLELLIQQEANGSLEASKSSTSQKSWWNLLP